MEGGKQKKHIVLVHGAAHGGWCWYKVVSLLKLGGHKVSALDLGASGIDSKKLDDITSIFDYLQPLMDLMASIPEDERILLVGHSMGGFGISLAMERFPQRIAAAVFVTALMPNCTAPPATLLQESFKWKPLGSLMDCTLTFGHGPENPPTSASFGPIYLEKMLYQNCTPEDIELAKMLVRPSGFFMGDLAKEFTLTDEKYGRIKRVFVVCEEDMDLNEGFLRWMVEKSPPDEVKVISKAGHVVMLSRPPQLSHCLLDISQNYV